MKKVFALKDLTNVATTRHEILFLVQAFLRARSKVIPPPPRPSLSSSTSNESQDLYDEFGFDDDVLAALDLGDGAIVIDVNKEHEQTVSDVRFISHEQDDISKHVSLLDYEQRYCACNLQISIAVL